MLVWISTWLSKSISAHKLEEKKTEAGETLHNHHPTCSSLSCNWHTDVRNPKSVILAQKRHRKPSGNHINCSYPCLLTLLLWEWHVARFEKVPGDRPPGRRFLILTMRPSCLLAHKCYILIFTNLLTALWASSFLVEANLKLFPCVTNRLPKLDSLVNYQHIFGRWRS